MNNKNKMTYSKDLRKKVIEAFEGGMSQEEVSRVFKIGTGTIKRWRKIKKETGKLEPRKRSSESYDFLRKIPNSKLDEFKEFVLQNAEMTHQQIADHWQMSDSAVEDYLKKLKITRKKRLIAIKSDQKKKETNGKRK